MSRHVPPDTRVPTCWSFVVNNSNDAWDGNLKDLTGAALEDFNCCDCSGCASADGCLGGNRILDNFIVGETGSRELLRLPARADRIVAVFATKSHHKGVTLLGPHTHRVALIGFALAALHYRLLTHGFALRSSHSLAALHR
jgi:hypothetical protein